jgi:hypothetical protein
MSQLSYSVNQGIGASGQIAFPSPSTTLTWNNPTDEVPYGRMLAKVAGDDNGAKLPTADSDVMVGVAVLEQNRADDHYPAKSAMAVLKRGQIYVEVEEDVTPDNDVFVRFADGAGGTEKGIFRTDADTDTAVQVTNARYLTSASAGGFAIVDLNLI